MPSGALTLLLIFAGLTLSVRASEPALLTGAFAPVPAEAARQTECQPGMLWSSEHIDNQGAGTLELPLPAAPETLALYLTGFPDGQKLRLSLQSLDRQQELKLAVRAAPGSAWVLYRWSLPAAWQGKPAVLVAEDDSPDLWMGVGLPAGSSALRAANWRALVVGLGATLLTVLPFFTAVVLLRPRFGRDRPLLVTLSLVASGVFALAVFFGFFLSHALGLGVLVAGGGAALLAGARLGRERLRPFGQFLPLLATLCLATAILATTFLYGGSQSSMGIPADRHELHLPVDNLIPQFFEEKIFRQEPLRPFLLDWLTSDRPPLQAGGMLVSRPLADRDTARVAAAIATQFAVYAGLWVLLDALGIPRRAARLCLLACVTSGFFLVNTMFAWPKLLPAGFLLAATGLLYRLNRERRRATPAEIAALGGCAALAMLGHGGSFFGLLGLGLVHFAWRGGWRDLRLLAGGAAVALVLYSPWIAYQRLADPPGDRLLKYHLADHPAVDPRGALSVIAEAYQQISAGRILANKWANARVLVGDPVFIGTHSLEMLRDGFAGHWANAYWRFVSVIQSGAFFHLLQSLGVLAVGLPGLWLARKTHPQWAHAGAYCLQVVLATVIVWCVLMFGPGATLVHQGSYLTGALLHAAGVLGLLAAVPAPWRRTVFGLHFAVFAGVWVFSPEWNAWHWQLRPTWEPFWLGVLALAGAGLGWCGVHLAVGREEA